MDIWTLTFRLFIFISCVFVFAVSCSDSDENNSSTAPSKHGNFSSDDEDSVVHGASYETGLEDAFEAIELEETKSWRRGENEQSFSDYSARPLMCLDGAGREVDWWFVYKESGGSRYLYYSSLDAEEDRSTFHPLNRHFLIHDPQTSPVLRTIYHQNYTNPSEVWFAWNDQPEHEEEKKTNLDGYGASINGVKHAHSKGFYAINAYIDQSSPKEAKIGAYAIMTSLPRFPKLEQMSPTVYGAANRSRLPTHPSKIFDSNFEAKAQHFMCTSFPRQKVTMERSLNDILEIPIDQTHPHLQFLTKYLKTIHPAIVGTNFNDQRNDHWIWRNYFSMLNIPYPVASYYYLNKYDNNVKLQAYATNELPSYAANGKASRAFPLSTSPFYVAKNGTIYHDASRMRSRWEADFAMQNGCIDGDQAACLSSFSYTTTSSQSPLKVQMFAKHGLLILDIYDDWAALQVVEAQKTIYSNYDGQMVSRYGLLVQSWQDSKTGLPRKPDKKIFNKAGELEATVHIDNRSNLEMPVRNGAPIKVKSVGHDHSKWALAFALDTFNHLNDDLPSIELEKEEYSFVPLFFLSDLNRANTQACLKDKNQGRGGGILSTDNAFLWRAMMYLQPLAQKQKFANNGKSKQKKLQNRLRKHTSSSWFSWSSFLPLEVFRPSLFHSLRLSKRDGKKMNRVIPFIPMLRELGLFIKEALHKPEHTAIAAFQRLWASFAQGKIKDSASTAWHKTKRESKFKDEAFPYIKSSVFYKIPALQLFRTLPPVPEWSDDEYELGQLDFEAPYIVQNKADGVIQSTSSIDGLLQKLKEYPRTASTQTETIQEESVGESDEESVEEEEENNSDEESVEEEECNSDEESVEENNSENDSTVNTSRSSGSSRYSSDHYDTEYYDIMKRQWAENDGEDSYSEEE